MAKPLDPVTRYATGVCDGTIIAGRLARLACQRHLDDLAHGPARGLVWKPADAQRAINFFPEILCLPEETAESVGDAPPPVDGSPFVLTPSQQFIVGSLHGWFTTAGVFRYLLAFVLTGKGFGKTPLGAGLMLYRLITGAKGSQIFAAATAFDQAKLAYTDAVKMVTASP